MKKFSLLGLTVVILALVLSACAPANTVDEMMAPTAEGMMGKATEVMMAESSSSDSLETAAEGEMMDDSSDSDMAMQAAPTSDAMMEQSGEEAMMAVPDWFATELTNVNTGDTFTINDLKGKVVLVETMAQWCSNCLKQQKQVMALHALLDENADLVRIALDIDPNEDEFTLKEYALNHGFDWVYAVAPAEVSREIGNLYTAQFLNPPSTPILIVDRSGMAHPLPFGIKSAEDLKQAIEPFLSEGM